MRYKGGSLIIKDITFWKNERPEHYDFVVNELENNRHVIVSASVKVGKQQLVYVSATLSKSVISKNDGTEKYRHVFLSNYARNDCVEQKNELLKYGIESFFGKDLSKSINVINNHLKDNNVERLYVHIDESDYGTGKGQSFDNVFKFIGQEINTAKLYTRLYSATNEEACYSNFKEKYNIPHVSFKDPDYFYGPDDFISENKVIEAEQFWDVEKNDFSMQGNQAIQNWLTFKSNKYFSVLRVNNKIGKTGSKIKPLKKSSLTYDYIKNNKTFEDKLNSLGIKLKFIDDKSNSFYWGKEDDIDGGWKDLLSILKDPTRKFNKCLLVINQMCSRSTEVGFHPLIAFWHDFRKKSSYATQHQALMRVSHYPYKINEIFPEETDITVYGHINTFKLAAKLIDVEEYCSKENGYRQLSTRIDSGKEYEYQREIIICDSYDECKDKMKEKYPYSTGQTIQNISEVGIKSVKQKLNDYVSSYILNLGKMSGTEIRGYYVDEKSQYITDPDLKKKCDQSWEKLKKEHPEYIGKYIFVYEDVTKKIPISSKTKKSMYQLN